MSKIYCNTDKYGNEWWYLDSKRHRVDGPAIECSNGDNFWFLYGGFHRADGPAVEYCGGWKARYLNNKRYTEETYWEEVEMLCICFNY